MQKYQSIFKELACKLCFHRKRLVYEELFFIYFKLGYQNEAWCLKKDLYDQVQFTEVDEAELDYVLGDLQNAKAYYKSKKLNSAY